jgi:hypothetical protein
MRSAKSQEHIRRRHLNGEHNRWCQKVIGKSIYCRFTDQQIGKVSK